jgi:hypothetical protein
MSEKVYIGADVRLDLGDFNAVQDLRETDVLNTIGALFGNVNGCTSPWAATLSSGGGHYYVSLGAFQFVLTVPTLTDDGGTTYKAWQTRAVTHNPLAGAQVSLVEYTDARAQAIANNAAEAYPFVYARPYLIKADTAARKKWIAGAQTVSTQTRYRERVEFKLSSLVPSNAANAGWACVGKLYLWANGLNVANPGAPTFIPLLWTDSPEKYANAGQAGNWWDPVATSTSGSPVASGLVSVPGYDYTASPSRDLGVGAFMVAIFSKLQRHLAIDKSKAWFADPVADLKTLLASIVEMQGSPVAWAAGNCTFDSVLVKGKNCTTATVGNTTVITLDPVPAFAYEVIAVDVTPKQVSAMGNPQDYWVKAISYNATSATITCVLPDGTAALPPLHFVVWIKRT